MRIFSSSSEDGASGSSWKFLSRMSRSNTNRHVHDFYIQLDEPHREYAAGDEVKGRVVLIVTKTIPITHLVVSLHGRVRVVLKDTDTVHDDGAFEQVVGHLVDDKPRYHGGGMLTLFRQEQVIGGDGSLRGPNRFEQEFTMTLPAVDGEQPGCGLPSSVVVRTCLLAAGLQSDCSRTGTDLSGVV
jgi:arrestin-related trafficking adapter 9